MEFNTIVCSKPSALRYSIYKLHLGVRFLSRHVWAISKFPEEMLCKLHTTIMRSSVSSWDDMTQHMEEAVHQLFSSPVEYYDFNSGNIR